MSTPERTTLVERMQRASARVAAANGRVPTAPAPLLASRPMPLGGVATPAAAPEGTGWQLPAEPGEELFLMPGQLHFGGQVGSIRTLLGSCVAITLWHPERRLAGMCHFLLPSRARPAGAPPDGRYGEEAVQVLLQRIHAAGTEPQDYHAHLYGGADTMPDSSNLRFNVGERNIEAGWHFVDRSGFQLQGVDVGEDVPRSVRLVRTTGAVEMRRGQGHAPAVRLPPHHPILPPGPAGPQRVRGLP